MSLSPPDGIHDIATAIGFYFYFPPFLTFPFSVDYLAGSPQASMRHHPAAGHGQCGAHREGAAPEQADPQGPSRQDLCHALGVRQQVLFLVLIPWFYVFLGF